MASRATIRERTKPGRKNSRLRPPLAAEKWSGRLVRLRLRFFCFLFRLRLVHVRSRSSSGLRPHGAPLLGRGWVDSHGRVEMGLQGTCLHGDRDALHHLGGVSSAHVRPDDSSRARLAVGNDDQLHQDLLLLGASCGHGVLQGLELLNVDVDGAILGGSLLLCEPASSDGGLTENRARDVVVVGLRRFSQEQSLREGDALHEGDRRQVHSVRHVAQGVNRVDVGLAVLVHKNLAGLLVQLDTDLFQSHLVGIGLSASCEHNDVGSDLVAILGLQD
mmetsp:Transcript_39150/g.59136  ORF Transcript_39150/g.59136 Transcript_39150/m.59136 type:complete len:275 (+) Transcript_39150:352-1176(+)